MSFLLIGVVGTLKPSVRGLLSWEFFPLSPPINIQHGQAGYRYEVFGLRPSYEFCAYATCCDIMLILSVLDLLPVW